jgi:acyl carrier protein
VILHDVVATIENHFGVQATSLIDEETRLFADLGLASIDAVVLSEAIQDHYARSLPFHELMAEIGRRTERDVTIGAIVAFLGRHL